MVKDFWFVDHEAEEEFFVECETKEEAFEIAREYFNDPHLVDIVSVEFAEMVGLDTY